MIAHIICPGPSLARFIPALTYLRAASRHTFIAVNRAADAIDHDWLAAGDRNAFGRDETGKLFITTIARVGVVTFADTCRWIRSCGDPDVQRFAHLELRQWEDLQPRPADFQWSVQAALLLAQQLGAVQAHLYGCDQVGTQDWDGTPQSGRGDQRWSREREHLNATITLLSIPVIRHQAPEHA